MADSEVPGGVNNAFHGTSLYYSNVLKKDRFTKDEADRVLWEIANKNWGGNVYNQLTWLAQKALPRIKTNDWRVRIRCHYHKTCGCKWICEQIGNYENEIFFCIGNLNQINHDVNGKKKALCLKHLF